MLGYKIKENYIFSDDICSLLKFYNIRIQDFSAIY